MMRETYVEQDGKVVDIEEKNKKWLKKNLIILGVILFIVLMFFVSRAFIRSSYCGKIIDKITKGSIEYMEEQKKLPISDGDFVTVELEDLLENRKITKQDITVNKKIATGVIKITRYQGEYITTVELKDCDYCDSSKKKWSGEENKKPNNKIIDVIAYYNYQNKSINYTNWTIYFTNDQLDKKVDKNYKIRLPKEKNLLPQIAKDAKIANIEQETKEYYRYRDKRWLYYSGGGDYSDYFSSEKPNGYEKFDKDTIFYTEWSDYSLNYPDKKAYRNIEQRTGYKWFYLEKGKKHYYRNGEYVVEALGNKEYKQDVDAGSTNMYRYRDSQWRWYNGVKRKYSGYSSTLPRGYQFRDDGMIQYGAFNNWTEVSSLNSGNSSYREEEVDTRYRFRIKYNVFSLAVLPKSVKKGAFESNLHMNIDEILKKDDIKVNITYTFRYKK